ncbi:unnamed protein product [Schistocephalus solidus]|uniref:Diacylglycerol kinase accessory domain-containing protein n=1 Tax=Schistocephalus solidus TaxID=70667 RepID=A0A3P7D7U4_SCHSO|nr:unnamed protein product [Schistocephalus solidus]
MVLTALLSEDFEGGGLDDISQLTPSCLHGSIISWSMQVLQFLGYLVAEIKTVDVVEAEEIRLDRWTVVIKPDHAESDAQKKQLQIEANACNTNEDTSRIFVMNNYFGLGIDADLNLDFHLAREENPAKFNSRMELDALRTLNADRIIVILPADKGRSTVELDMSEYLQKANALLDDRHAYLRCDGDPMKKLVAKINATLASLQSNGAISKAERLTIKPTDSAMARFYGLPKVHKHGAPLRPIISLRGTPTFNLANLNH